MFDEGIQETKRRDPRLVLPSDEFITSTIKEFSTLKLPSQVLVGDYAVWLQYRNGWTITRQIKEPDGVVYLLWDFDSIALHYDIPKDRETMATFVNGIRDIN